MGPKSCTVADAIDRALSFVTPLIRAYEIDLRREIDPGLPCPDADPNNLVAVLVASLTRSLACLAAQSEQRELTVRAFGAANEVNVEIADTGLEVPPEFHRTWLNQVKRACRLKDRGGLLSAREVRTPGNLVTVHLLRKTAAAPPMTKSIRVMAVDRCAGWKPKGPEQTPSKCALIVEGPAPGSNRLDLLLKKRGFQVVKMNSGSAALFSLTGRTHDLLFIDLDAEDMDGPTLYAAISKEFPKLLASVIFTGTATRHQKFLDETKAPVLEIPVSEERLAEALARTREGPPRRLCSGLRALVIDDSVMMQNLIEGLLKKRGCQVEKVSNGYEGLLKIRLGKYDLIFVDLVMPGMDGGLLIRLIAREYPDLLRRVVVISGSIEKHRPIIEGYKLSVLMKPFEAGELYRLIDSKFEQELEQELVA